MIGFSGILAGHRRFAMVTGVLLMLAPAGVALAAGGDGHHADSGVLLKDFLYRTLNFAVTVGLLAYFITKPLRRALAGRQEGIEKALQQAEIARQEAEGKFAEYDRKLSRAAAEIDDIYAEIRREGELEREKILTNAREMAVKIRLEAERTAANEVARARAELRQDAARLAVELAEGLLKKNMTADDQSRLIDEYMRKVGELH
jgi:F-type H+-transporting ATPase subunit b